MLSHIRKFLLLMLLVVGIRAFRLRSRPLGRVLSLGAGTWASGLDFVLEIRIWSRIWALRMVFRPQAWILCLRLGFGP